MIHRPQGRTGRWLGRGLAAVLTSLVFGIGSSPAQAPAELPLTAPEARAKPLPQRRSKDSLVVTPAVAQEIVKAPETKAKAKVGAELPAPKEAEKETPSLQITDPNVKKASCSSCGGLWHLATGHGYAGGACVPGRPNCHWDHWDSCCGRIVGGLYQCLCCPDPCYEPCWIDAANAAFFQDNVRPVTMTRLRWNGAREHSFPDTAEMFWARRQNGGKGKGPKFDPANNLAANEIDYDEFVIYQEIAAGGFSFFFEIPYRALNLHDNTPSASGFSDMNVGTKSLILDCELIQMAFMFRTYLPAGSFGKGLGVGHVSLEPSLLTTFKLSHSTYLQTQIAEWIPIGGDSDFQGSSFQYHFSLNHALWQHSGAALIGVAELNGVSFQAGRFTPDGIPAAATSVTASDRTFVSAGPGLRFCLCHKYDIGFATAFGLTDHGPQQNYRLDFRVRF